MADYDVLVLGEINVDLILGAEEIVPVFGQEILVDETTLTIGGSSVIFACGAARLGLRVGYVGVVGEDEFGRFMLREMSARGVDVKPTIVDPTVKTGITVSLSTPANRRGCRMGYLSSWPRPGRKGSPCRRIRAGILTRGGMAVSGKHWLRPTSFFPMSTRPGPSQALRTRKQRWRPCWSRCRLSRLNRARRGLSLVEGKRLSGLYPPWSRSWIPRVQGIVSRLVLCMAIWQTGRWKRRCDSRVLAEPWPRGDLGAQTVKLR
jgi:hypothetical protein